MSISEALLPEWDHEMKTTRKLLERVPMDKLTWKPHEKSMAMGDLALHLATNPSWMKATIEQEALDLSGPQTPPQAETQEELLAIFDGSVAEGRKALESASDQLMHGMWTLTANGHTVFSMPRVTVARSFVMNHLIHHRGQLSVYLRLNEVPVPSMYGPSADERG